jgi:hypothetical protein
MTTETEVIKEKTETGQWDYYIGHSKIQRILLYLLSHLDEKVVFEDGYKVKSTDYVMDIELSHWNDVWCGALNVKTIKHLLFKNGHYTASQRASFSRSIKRLEVEGLITREKCISKDGYTTHIGLTERGFYQVPFEESWYGNKKLQELLTFYGIKSGKFSQKVNKKGN